MIRALALVAVLVALIWSLSLSIPRATELPRLTPDGWVRHTVIEGGVEHRILHTVGSPDCEVCYPEMEGQP